MNNLIRMICVFLILIFSSITQAGFEEGVAVNNVKNYQLAVKEFKALAERGNSDAQYNLALLYIQGQGVPQDYPIAANWLLKASDLGNASAQANLGMMYINGDGVPKNYVVAYALCKMASYKTGQIGFLDVLTRKLTPAEIKNALNLTDKMQILGVSKALKAHFK